MTAWTAHLLQPPHLEQHIAAGMADVRATAEQFRAYRRRQQERGDASRADDMRVLRECAARRRAREMFERMMSCS